MRGQSTSAKNGSKPGGSGSRDSGTTDPRLVQFERRQRRHLAVLNATAQLRASGAQVTHDTLAERSGIPSPWLSWAYPHLEQLTLTR